MNYLKIKVNREYVISGKLGKREVFLECLETKSMNIFNTKILEFSIFDFNSYEKFLWFAIK